MPRDDEGEWTGPIAWSLFLGGWPILLAGGSLKSGFVMLLGFVGVVVGLIMLAATDRIWPKR